MKPKPEKKKNRNISNVHKCFMWPTSDNFCPNFEGNCVKISFSESKSDRFYVFRISVWGDDDLGYYKEILVFKSDRHETYMDCIKFLQNLPSPITIDFLKQQGFERD